MTVLLTQIHTETNIYLVNQRNDAIAYTNSYWNQYIFSQPKRIESEKIEDS